MKPVKYILIDTGSESNRIMMSDVGKMENGIQRSRTYETGSRILDFLIRIHFSYAILQKVDLPGKTVWNKYCVLDKLTTDSSYDYCIIIVNNAIHRLSVHHLNELQQKENIHLFSLILDPFDHLPENVRKQILSVNWEKIYSFQKSDCEKYDFNFTDRIYSRADLSSYAFPSDQKKDVYFIGMAKNRMDKIYDAYQTLVNAGCVCDFTVIADDPREFSEKYPGLKFQSKRVPYSEILRGIASAKCLLEICAEGQDGLTMRFYEAVFYNKMLITNNKTAISNELYNPRYMQVINSSEDIDCERILNMSEIDYHYNESFSPTRFVRGLMV